MYRQQYPDAPNLYARRPPTFQRSIWSEWRRAWLTTTIGFVMIIGGLGGLFHNEGRAVQLARSLDEGHRKVIIPETNEVVFDENNGKLVLVADELNIEDPLQDTKYGISIHAVKLKKIVQMYQWYEIEDQQDNSAGAHEGDHEGHVATSYSYNTGWFDHLIDSERFDSSMGHHNPEEWPQDLNSSVIENPRVKLGNFLLGKDVKSKFTSFTTFTSDERPSSRDIKMHAGLYFHGNDVWKPEVGDIRVQFSYSGRHGEPITVVGKQSGRELRPYQTDSGDELLLLHQGFRKASEIFHLEKSHNQFQNWIWRGVGWFVIFLGGTCMEQVLEFIVWDYPSVRNALVFGYTSLPFAFASCTSIAAIGIGWLFYRPLLGCILLFIASLPYCIGLVRYLRARSFERRHRLS